MNGQVLLLGNRESLKRLPSGCLFKARCRPYSRQLCRDSRKQLGLHRPPQSGKRIVCGSNRECSLVYSKQFELRFNHSLEVKSDRHTEPSLGRKGTAACSSRAFKSQRPEMICCVVAQLEDLSCELSWPSRGMPCCGFLQSEQRHSNFKFERSGALRPHPAEPDQDRALQLQLPMPCENIAGPQEVFSPETCVQKTGSVGW